LDFLGFLGLYWDLSGFATPLGSSRLPYDKPTGTGTGALVKKKKCGPAIFSDFLVANAVELDLSYDKPARGPV